MVECIVKLLSRLNERELRIVYRFIQGLLK